MDKHYCYTVLYICIETVCLITEQLRWQNILFFILQLLHRATFFAAANKYTLLMFFSKNPILWLIGSWLCINVMWCSSILLRNTSLLQTCQIYSYDKVMNAGLLYRKAFAVAKKPFWINELLYNITASNLIVNKFIHGSWCLKRQSS